MGSFSLTYRDTFEVWTIQYIQTSLETCTCQCQDDTLEKISQNRINLDQERHEQQLKGLNGGGRSRGREDVADRSKKVSDAIEKAIEDAAGSMMQQQQQQRRGRNLPGGHHANRKQSPSLVGKLKELFSLVVNFWAGVRNLSKNFARDLERHPIRIRMGFVTLFILIHCTMYAYMYIFGRVSEVRHGPGPTQPRYNIGGPGFVFRVGHIHPALEIILADNHYLIFIRDRRW